MSQLERLDRYGFPIGVSIDFRRAMYRFEAVAKSMPADLPRLRAAKTQLIDGRPSDALRELAALPDTSTEKPALVGLARRQLRGDEISDGAPLPRPGGTRPRVNVVLPLPVQYGGMRVQVSVARTLAAAGFDVHVLQMRNSPDGERVDPRPFARVVDIQNQDDLYRELSAERAALTMVGCWVDYPPAVEAGTAPVIGYSGGEPTLNEDSKLDDRMLAFRQAAHQLPVHLVTCSRFVQRVYDQIGRTSSYVPVALDDRAFRTRAHSVTVADRRTRVLLLAWDGIEDKGLDYAIPALENLRRAGRDIEIVWITPKAPVKFTDLECELHVDPPKDDLYQLIGGCHALVYTPIVDGLGLPPLEAMAAGVPVVVSTGTGPDEFARDGMNAICVPPKSTEAIEQAVLRLLDDPDLGRSLGVHGRATASRYHSATTASALLNVVAQVLRHDAAVASPEPIHSGGTS